KRKYGSTIYSRTHRTKKNELLLKLINYNLHKTTKIETLIQGFLQSRIIILSKTILTAMNIVRKTVHGVSWVALFTVTTRVVGFLTTLVLARLLTPEDFGLVAIGLLAINTLAIFRDLGVGPALIHQKGDIKKAADTTFTLLPIIGLLLFIVAYFISPLAAGFFNNAESELVVKYLSITLLIVSLGLTPAALLDKELEFRKQFLPEVGSVLSYGAVAIALAFSGFGVWSIVYGKIASSVVWLMTIWMVSPWRPSFSFDGDIARDLLSYGRHILGGKMIFFFLFNLDNGVVGKFLGAASLGFYYMAFNVSYIPGQQISRLVNRVLFPTYTKLQDNKESLVRVYLKTITYISSVSIPLSIGIMVLAPDIIMVVLGEKWMPSLLPLQVLCIASIFHAMNGTTGVLFNALGRPEIQERITLYQFIILGILIYPMTMGYGILGTSIAVTFPVVLMAIFSYNVAGNLLNIDSIKFVDALKIPVLCSFFMGAAIYAVQFSQPATGAIKLVLLVTIGIATYGFSILIFGRSLIKEFKGMLGAS
ncbi:MAG: lipopolysaccharide biosynthesis protein, partial [Candidatus Altiarchaeota archaeon]